MVSERFIQVLLSPPTVMVAVRYGSAGDPIAQSLSPVLARLVVAHIAGEGDGKKSADMQMKRVMVIPARKVEDALAWAYVDALPHSVDWELSGAEIHRFATTSRLDKAVEEATESVTECPDELSQRGESPHLPVGPDGIPGSSSEVWLSLTSPLKHQLGSASLRYVDDSMGIESLNCLRWNNREWWVASTDGPGLILVAEHLGINMSEEPILDLRGGGGAARSAAWAWSAEGGLLRWLGGRRELREGGPWEASMAEDGKDAALTVDFEDQELEVEGLVLNAKYGAMHGSYEERILALADIDSGIDGRWLLAAQHLISWSTLWRPDIPHKLPDLGLLLARLAAVEAYFQ